MDGLLAASLLLSTAFTPPRACAVGVAGQHRAPVARAPPRAPPRAALYATESASDTAAAKQEPPQESIAEDAEIFADAVASFSAIDLDGDGQITHDELRSHLRGCGYSMSAANTIFAALDTNEDGVLTLEELADGFVRYEALREAPGLGWSDADRSELDAEADAAFAQIDTDGNGEVSIDECRSFLTAQRGYTAAAADAIFETLDLNSDGGISRVEWEDACARYSALRRAFGLRVGGGAPGDTTAYSPEGGGAGPDEDSEADADASQ